jgi:hypothetical protein
LPNVKKKESHRILKSTCFIVGVGKEVSNKVRDKSIVAHKKDKILAS